MSDIDGKVTGIQGNAVLNQTLGSAEDGYVFTWDNLDGYVAFKPINNNSTGLRKSYFNSSGTWTCPTGIYNVLIIGAGGGQGGSSLGGPSLGSIQTMNYIQVVPSTTYNVSIGGGGIGGTYWTIYGTGPAYYQNNPIVSGTSPTNGGDTTFSNGSILLYKTVGAGSVGPTPSYINTYSDGTAGASGGTSFTGSVNCSGGLGGQAGPQGNGAHGGNGAICPGGSSVSASNGSNASPNSGAGGGGGGQCGASGYPYTASTGNGGSGGSGYLYIIY